MNIFVDLFRKSGTKDVCHATGDERELRRMAERLRVSVKEDARGLHLDLTEHQRALAIRYGAQSATYAKETNGENSRRLPVGTIIDALDNRRSNTMFISVNK